MNVEKFEFGLRSSCGVEIIAESFSKNGNVTGRALCFSEIVINVEYHTNIAAEQKKFLQTLTLTTEVRQSTELPL